MLADRELVKWADRLEAAAMVNVDCSPFMLWMFETCEDEARFRELEALCAAAWHNGYMTGRGE